MKALAAQAMRDGAFGLSTGLYYVPGNFTPTEEVIEIAKVVGRMGGIHISHMRDEASHVLDSERETIRIGEEGGLPTQITHHKVIGKANWGASVESLKLVEAARARCGEIAHMIAAELDCTEAELFGLAHVAPGDGLPPMEEVEKRLDGLKDERERLGGVNLRAEEELNEILTSKTILPPSIPI